MAKVLVVDEIELLDYALPNIKIRVVCSKGTYIRALARDIGLALNSGAHLTSLQRTRIGEITLDKCLEVDQIDQILPAEENREKDNKQLSEIQL